MFFIFPLVIVSASLLLAVGVFGWCLYLSATQRARRAAVVLGLALLGGLGAALVHGAVCLYVQEPGACSVEGRALIFAMASGWVGAVAAIVAQLLPLFGQSNSWSARSERRRNGPRGNEP
ncbi:MAG: hypothetical protein RLZZ618_1390 [Pseudomonadota bacterium]|jgi:hypothetical protein